LWAWLAACADHPEPRDRPLPETGAIEVSAGGPTPLGLADIAVADDAVWVAWVAEDPDVPNGRDVLVSRSTDGVTFEPPIAVAPELEPAGLWPRIPRLSVTGNNGILLAFTAVEPTRELVEVYRATPESTDFNKIFERPRTAEDDAVELLLPVARTGIGGPVWVIWVLARGATGELHVAREDDDWREIRVDAGGSEPACTCCPVDFAINEDRAMFVWRGGERRELLVAEATTYGIENPLEISDFGLVFLNCPLDGPTVAASGSRFEVIASDADPAGPSLWSIHEEAPRLWADPAPIPADDPGGRVPSIAGDRMAFDSDDGPRLAERVEGAWGESATWSEMADASEPVRLASGEFGSWAVRVDADGRVWAMPQ
jgi:hypothetical protein